MSEAEREPVSEPEPASEAEPASAPEPEPESEPASEAEPASAPEPEPESEPEPASEPEPTRPAPGRPEAAAAIWRWDEATRDANEAARASKVRRSAILRALVGFVVAAIFFAFGRIIVSLVVGGIATLTLVLGLASPLGIYARLDALIEKAGELAAKVLGWLLLAPLFYGFFLPFGLLFRRGAKDPMARSFDRDRDSYWEDREGARSLDKPY